MNNIENHIKSMKEELRVFLRYGKVVDDFKIYSKALQKDLDNLLLMVEQCRGITIKSWDKASEDGDYSCKATRDTNGLWSFTKLEKGDRID